MITVGKFLRLLGADVWRGIKKLTIIFLICVCAVSVLASVLSIFGEGAPGPYMPLVHGISALSIAYFYGYILREVAKEWEWERSVNVKHLLVVLISFAFFFFMTIMCVGGTITFDVWIGDKLTLGQVWEQRSVFENLSMYTAFAVLAFALCSPILAYIIDVCNRLNKDE